MSKYCACKNPCLLQGEEGWGCATCNKPIAEENHARPPAKSVNMNSQRKARRAMTDVESQEWRDLSRRVRMYEETFGVRYSRD
jgi:hypothetical protein